MHIQAFGDSEGGTGDIGQIFDHEAGGGVYTSTCERCDENLRIRDEHEQWNCEVEVNLRVYLLRSARQEPFASNWLKIE